MAWFLTSISDTYWYYKLKKKFYSIWIKNCGLKLRHVLNINDKCHKPLCYTEIKHNKHQQKYVQKILMLHKVNSYEKKKRPL